MEAYKVIKNLFEFNLVDEIVDDGNYYLFRVKKTVHLKFKKK